MRAEGGRKLFKKRVNSNSKKKKKQRQKGEEELHHTYEIQVLFCKLGPGTAVPADATSPEMHTPSLQPHEIHGDYGNVQQSDRRVSFQVL